MKPKWTYRDILDLEYFQHLDGGVSPQELHRRDRNIRRSAAIPPDCADRDVLLQTWLEARRKQTFEAAGATSPGDVLGGAMQAGTAIALLAALLTGIAGGLSFFSYSGTTPVNVFHFLVLFVFSQLALLLILLLAGLLRLAGVRSVPSATARIYGSFIAGLARRGAGRLLKRLPADTRSSFEQAAGLVRRLTAGRRSLFFWPLFTLSQAVMVTLNCGLLAASLFRILTSDLAFGWQSTVQFSAPFIHRVVALLALPWSWFVPQQYAYPSLEEIEGSRIVLKDGIYHLATQDLISWWPFLLMSLLVYGLLLRFALAVFGRYGRYRALRRFSADRPEFVRIVQRLQTPLVSTQAPAADDSPRSGVPAAAEPIKGPVPSGLPATVLVADDIGQQLPEPALVTLLAANGISVHRVYGILRDYAADRALLHEFEHEPEAAAGTGGFLLLFEAWMVPINDTLSFLADLRAILSETTPIFVGLVGRRQDDKLFSRPDPHDSRIWRRKINALGDPYMSILELDAAPRPLPDETT